MRKQLTILFGQLFVLGTLIAAENPSDMWKPVGEAMEKGLPKTALEALDPILESAIRDRDFGNAAFGVARKVQLEAEIEGDKPEEKIRRLEREMADTPDEMDPILNAVLAKWYWTYFQQNRWRFAQRTATAETPSEDFETWDLARLFARIGEVFERALANSELLKSAPVQAYEPLLEVGAMSDRHRPTLYDFIVYEALDFYTSGEQAGAQPIGVFEIEASDPVFDDLESFLAWEPASSQADASLLKAIVLYQELIRFHREDTDVLALADADLARLRFGFNQAVGESKEERYVAALKRYVDRWADAECASVALHEWANLVRGQGDWQEAHRLASRGRDIHPESPGGQMCENIVRELEAKSLEIATEWVWSRAPREITVTYRNVEKVHFRVVPFEWRRYLEGPLVRDFALPDEERERLRSGPAALTWSQSLEPTTDYKERTVTLPVPKEVGPGFYLVLASHRADFAETDNWLRVAGVWVSDLTLVLRAGGEDFEGWVLDAESGQPIDRAKVEIWGRDPRSGRDIGLEVSTDARGVFSVEMSDRVRSPIVLASKGNQKVSSHQFYANRIPPTVRPYQRTVFFTDRALYRPGQTIQYKGVCYSVDAEKDEYQVIAGGRVTVVFEDTNQKEVARQELRCNDQGSFAGSFTAPSDRLPGGMRIRVHDGPSGMAWVRVEEYKRPRFGVTLDPPIGEVRLGEEVRVTGRALAYTGSAIDNGQVKYRVQRTPRFPRWWGYWRRSAGSQSQQEIAHGAASTRTDGTFEVVFTALPDRAIPESDDPRFDFLVTADVTDGAGETRSAQQNVRVGYTALDLDVELEEWQEAGTPVSLRISAATLDGEPLLAEGVLRVHRLKEPERVHRKGLEPEPWYGRRTSGVVGSDLSDPEQWELGAVELEKGFATEASGKGTNGVTLPAGAWRVVLESQDRFGKPVRVEKTLQVVDPEAPHLLTPIPHRLQARSWSVEPGEEFVALWGTGYPTGRAFVEIEHRGRIVEAYWTNPETTQHMVRRPVDEGMRGGFALHVTFVRENRAYLESRFVDVPWTNKSLEIRWEHMTSRLDPGQKETWTAVVKPVLTSDEKAVGNALSAEAVATLYDASLDQFQQHRWPWAFGVFRQFPSSRRAVFQNPRKPFHWQWGSGWTLTYMGVDMTYRHFAPGLIPAFFPYPMRGGGLMMADSVAPSAPAPTSMRMMSRYGLAAEATPAEPMMAKAVALDGEGEVAGGGGEAEPESVDLSQVSARRNLQETAFFFPQLTVDEKGEVRMTFTMPEALTEWKFMGFAHDADLRSGYWEGKTVTAKDLMVQPNPPRFLREGDTLEFTVKVSNQSEETQSGSVQLSFADAATGESVDAALQNAPSKKEFSVPAGESRTYSWRIQVPDGPGVLVYKAVAAGGKLSDGEEGYLPVLSRRVLMTESLPLPIRGPATKTFEFARLLNSGDSSTLQHQNLVVQMTSRPAWYAVMALPYLMEFPHECIEQTFNRFYANALARHIARSDEDIRRTFDLWRGAEALDSPLEKNEDLKRILLEETPWVRQANNESEARRNVGALFDDNRLSYELDQALRKVREAQMPSGAWSWFPGGPESRYITLYVATGFGRLRHLGVDVDVNVAIQAWVSLDQWIVESYQRILKDERQDRSNLSSTIALYLYGRSFFVGDVPLSGEAKEAVDYFLKQAREHWLDLGWRQSQGHLALGLKRFGDTETARAIMRSIQEHAVHDDELGTFWRDTERSWWWYRAPIETQALMIEAFDEVMDDAATVEGCKVWLLKQKQTQDWKTTKATADAVYALLLRGEDLLSSSELVQVEVGGESITPTAREGRLPEGVEPGTGFYEKRYESAQITEMLGRISVKKVDTGVAWGSVHWQYLEDLSRVTPHEGTPLQLKKSVYTKENTDAGPVLKPVTGAVGVGDEFVMRIELRTDRDVEYVHLKDQRGSGTEPVNVLSGYRFQDGLGYYEATRDTASHFFIHYLPKGVYVFEYSVRVQHRGVYPTGVAEVQCMYAPEFNSHSESIELKVE